MFSNLQKISDRYSTFGFVLHVNCGRFITDSEFELDLFYSLDSGFIPKHHLHVSNVIQCYITILTFIAECLIQNINFLKLTCDNNLLYKKQIIRYRELIRIHFKQFMISELLTICTCLSIRWGNHLQSSAKLINHFPCFSEQNRCRKLCLPQSLGNSI